MHQYAVLWLNHGLSPFVIGMKQGDYIKGRWRRISSSMFGEIIHIKYFVTLLWIHHFILQKYAKPD